MIVQVIIIAVLLVAINQRTEVQEAQAPLRTKQFMQDEREIEEGFFHELADWRWDK